MIKDILTEEALPARTPRYQYEGVEQCLRCYELESEHHFSNGQSSDYSYVIFDHVDDHSFQKCFGDDSERSLLSHSLDTYNFISHTLVLKMITDIHEAAHRAFCDIFLTWYRNQQSRLLPTGGASVRGLTREKAPDSSWKTTIHLPGRDKKWPTVVVEVAWSEAMTKLKQDVLFWLRESEGQVMVVLTIKVTRRGSITIQHWGLEAAGGNSVKPSQTIHITRNRNPISNQHQVSGSMHIQFEDCFLRERRGDESDFVLSDDLMVEIAEIVWAHLPE